MAASVDASVASLPARVVESELSADDMLELSESLMELVLAKTDADVSSPLPSSPDPSPVDTERAKRKSCSNLVSNSKLECDANN